MSDVNEQKISPKIAKVYDGSITKSENSERGYRLWIKLDKPIKLNYNGVSYDDFDFPDFSAYERGLKELGAELDLQAGRVKIPRKALETIANKLNRGGKLMRILAYQKMRQKPEEEAYKFVEEAESRYRKTAENS